MSPIALKFVFLVLVVNTVGWSVVAFGLTGDKRQNWEWPDIIAATIVALVSCIACVLVYNSIPTTAAL